MQTPVLKGCEKEAMCNLVNRVQAVLSRCNFLGLPKFLSEV